MYMVANGWSFVTYLHTAVNANKQIPKLKSPVAQVSTIARGTSARLFPAGGSCATASQLW
jgi:hypothetical protein